MLLAKPVRLQVNVIGIDLAAEPIPSQLLGNLGRGSRSHERVKHDIARARASENARLDQAPREGGKVGVGKRLRCDRPHRPLVSLIGRRFWIIAPSGA
ncbi:hypothetical protein LCGC14_2083200, partial [marine sediment metagenome]